MIKYWEDIKYLSVYTTTFFYIIPKVVALSRGPENKHHLNFSRQTMGIKVNNIKINKDLLDRGFII